MLKRENIMCISSIDWDFIWQGHQEIMSAFAKNGNIVLFIENTGARKPTFEDIPRLKKRFINWLRSIHGFKEEMEGLFVYSPVILPYPYSRIASWINKYMLLEPLRRWMQITDFYEPIIWTFLPTRTALDIINNLPRKLLIYYCIADFYELADNPKKVSRTENELIKKCDLIFVQGDMIAEKCRKLNDNVYIFPFGVNIELFENFKSSPDKVPNDMRLIKRPILGYVGGIHRHIDFKLIKYIAKTHPEWSIVLIGPTQTNVNEISGLKNIFLLGKKDFSELPYYINEFNVSIIPYNKTEYTSTVYPTKLNEYHALGKPVVSTDLPEVENFNKENNNLVFVGKTREEFTSYISRIINNPTNEFAQERISAAKKNSWRNRIAEMNELIEDTLSKKSITPIDWRESFLKLYRQGQRKALKLAFIFLSIYLLIFYTPLLWFLASPLKISQPPQSADCIVVFAGGVGESGRPGQGYEERVGYAVNLYKKGYARHIIFSSGYKYVFEESLVMKALAVSLGVPEKVTTLEDKAINTYQNVKFTKEILDRNKWSRAMFISSPYHMLRVSLVVKKVAPEIKAVYTPIPDSHFYSRGIEAKRNKIHKQINLQQIRALIHEYLGILYYLYKGYI